MVKPIENPHPLAGDPIELQTFGPLPDIRYEAKLRLTLPSLTTQFDAALAKVTGDRGAVYGHPADDFGRANALKAVIADCPDPLVRHALEMIAVKIARLVKSPDHLDSLIDIAGYARTAVMCLDRKRQE